MDHETVAAYLTDLADMPATLLERACRDFGHRERADGETSWPTLGALRARCMAIQRVDRERRESNYLLNPPSGPELSPEKWEEMKTKLRAIIGKRTMR